jgi:ribosomal-protein-alanine N-acetyltransferase
MAKTRSRKHSAKRQRALASGRRIYLRKPTPRDGEEFVERVRDSRELHASWTVAPQSVDEYHQWIRKRRRPNCVPTFISRKRDDAIVGMVNLNEIVRGLTQMSYVGYFGFEPYTRQGYMTEGVAVILKYAFRDLKLHRVEAGIQPGNERSIALVKRLGFRYEGTAKRLIKIAGRWRDHERWAILAEEWRGKKG